MKRVLSAVALSIIFSASVKAQDNPTRWFANGNATGAVQNPLNLGNWSSPTTIPQYRFYTTDLSSQVLNIHSTRYSGGLLLTRESASGVVNLVSISGWSGVGSSMAIYNASNVVGALISTNGSDSYINSNLAIGTTSAQGYKLAVNGSAIFTQAKVKLFASWPDYVFKPDYDLRPLHEVEKFIQQNGHLPEVPSADEVNKEGQDLGATQVIMLKKIEELTLYVIGLKKENDQLKEELKKLADKK